MRNAGSTDVGASRALALCPPSGSTAPDTTPRKDLGCFQANGFHVPRNLEISLRGQAQHPLRRTIIYHFSAAQRGFPSNGGLAYVTSGAPARKEAEVALWVCVYWGRAVSGTRLEGGLGKGECPRAAATATVPVSARELAASLLDTQPLCAPGRCAPGSVGVKQKQELLQTAGRRDGPGPLPSVTPAYRLPGHGEHGDRQERQRSGER